VDARQQAAWREADRILDRLLDLAPEARAAALDAATDDPQVRLLARRLLAAHARRAGPLDAPPPAPEPVPAAADALAGTVLGRWRLLREIGRGGMATVYRAESVEVPVGRLAAVKVLSLGALAAGGRERFLREQQLLSRLRDPGIAPLYDAGVAADGTPWLAMMLVDGERIDAWCQARAAGLDARIGLLLQVAQALADAHRNLVVHRDIKPSNVLVDSGGHVRLLDFGIARLVDELDPERTTTAMRALTPQYAAPEQFAGAAPSTAMDVYGLGALAYRLLAGQPPQQAGHGAALLPPSRALRIDALGEGLDARRWGRALRGDLDTVLLKALAAQPAQRYASVEALAEDLQRWLQRRPIRARAPGLGYRLQRLVARHRWGTAAVLALGLSLVAGIAGTLWQADRASAQARRAQAEAESSQAQLVYLGSVLEALAPSTAEAREQDRQQLIAEAVRRARRDLAGRDALLATVELTLAGVAERAGDYAQAMELAGSALDRRRVVHGTDSAAAAEAMVLLGRVLEHAEPPDRERAQALVAAAQASLERAAPRSEALVEAWVQRAVQLGDGDRYAEAMALLDRAERLCADLGEPAACEQAALNRGALAARHGRWQEAQPPLQALLALREARYGDADARTLFAATQLAHVYSRAGQPARAVALLEHIHEQQALIYPTATRESLNTLQALAEALAAAGDLPRALELRSRHLEQAHALFGERHGELAVGYGNLGGLYFAMGRYADAAAAYAQGSAQYRAVYGADHAGVQICEANRADALRELGRPAEALPLQQRALAAIGALFGTDSARYAVRLTNLARTELALGDAAAALAHFDQAAALYRALDADGVEVRVVEASRSLALLHLGRRAEARRASGQALAELESRLGADHRFSGEALAAAVQAACAVPAAADCATLGTRAGAALAQPALAGGVRLRLEAALAAASSLEARPALAAAPVTAATTTD
jgi:eukaryotic-like serine/threonine-protein kinase